MAIQPCDGTSAQKWVFGANKSLRNGSKCMELAGGSTANGTAFRLASCNDSVNQMFHLNATDDLVAMKAGNKCADVFSGKSASGTPIKLWPCTGTANQTWKRVA